MWPEHGLELANHRNGHPGSEGQLINRWLTVPRGQHSVDAVDETVL